MWNMCLWFLHLSILNVKCMKNRKKNYASYFYVKKKKKNCLGNFFFFSFGFFWGQNLSMWLKWKTKLSFVLGVKSVAIWTLGNLFLSSTMNSTKKTKTKKNVIVVQHFKLNMFVLLWENCLFVKLLPSLVNVTFLKIVVIVLSFG